MPTIIHHANKPRPSWVRAGILLTVLFLLQGCMEGQNPGGNSMTEAVISGQAPYSPSSQLIFRSAAGEETSTPIGADSTFSARLRPGQYSILLKTASDTLQLIRSSVFVEDYLVVNFLEVEMVPVPRIESVSVPVIYADSAIVEWETDIESDGRVDYGLDQTYGASTFTETDLKTHHRIQLYGLNPGMTYHFRVVASRHGMESIQNISRDFAFVTTADDEE